MSEEELPPEGSSPEPSGTTPQSAPAVDGSQLAGPGYLRLVRRNSYNFVFAGILLLLYELSQLLVSGDIRVVNAIDQLLKSMFDQIPNGTLYVSFLLATIGVFYIAQDLGKGYRLRADIIGYMWLESLIWALVIYFNLSLLVTMLPMPQVEAMAAGGAQTTYWQNLSLALGAGFYEEFFFRFILVKLTIIVLVLLGMSRKAFATRLFTVLFTAVVFSLVHFDFIIGAMGDPWGWYPFLFRTAFGIIMSLMLVLRGFGITAWTHALYDVLVFTF